MRIAAAVFLVQLLVASSNPAAAETFWSDVSDALWRIHVEEEPVDPLFDLLESSGAARSSLSVAAKRGSTTTQAELRRIETGATRFWLLSGGIDNLPVGYFLRFGPGDQRIPGLRGSVGNCFEGAGPTCRTRTVQHRRDYTLGEAVCQCGMVKVLNEVPEGAMIGLPCYFGRPGTYFSYLFGYGPVPDSAAAALAAEEPEGPLRRSLCHASGRMEMGDGAVNPALRQHAPRVGLFAEALPVFVSVGRMDEELELDPKDVAHEVMALEGGTVSEGSLRGERKP